MKIMCCDEEMIEVVAEDERTVVKCFKCGFEVEVSLPD